ncbi:chromate transporter [Clostridium grantii]|uniref:Chromate transporter n=1 Tax=Clostridium grantii DSM 8605 TaxID=1121316 RepID=A0A1M5W606_9CLOT|nr:chromate transporter [Clostridium grantii]SHH82907.1 chromate transporter [Clostridium grantii DSM 8605]
MVLIKLFYIFFKIGMFAFGGGYVILPMIYQEIQMFNLMSVDEFSDIVALSQMTPGPIAINAATFVGYKSDGFWGACAATIGVTLPAFIIMLLIIAFINKFKESEIVQAVLKGIRPATVGLIATAIIFFSEASIVKKEFFTLQLFQNPFILINFKACIIFALTIFGAKVFKIGPIMLTILAGILGVIIL